MSDLARLTFNFREWFAQTNPSEANRDQFDRYLTELTEAALREAGK